MDEKPNTEKITNKDENNLRSRYFAYEKELVYRWNHWLVNSRYKNKALSVSNILGPRMIYIIVIILLIYSIINVDYNTSIRYYGVLLLGLVIFMPMKFGIRRRRPFLKDDRLQKVDPHTHKTSFPSGHSYWLSLVLLFLVFNFEWPLWSAIVLLLISISLSLLRITFGAHFPSDLVVGHLLSPITLLVFFSWLAPYWIWLIRAVFTFLP
jgi:membrane-associated phospholipid phosphatase